VLTPEEAIKQRAKEKVVTVQFRVTAVQDESQSPGAGFGVPVTHFTGRVVRVTGLVQPVLQPDKSEGPFWIDVDDLKHFAVVRQ
jgi:hypothetical protein